ncbi:serine protease inhibitor 42Dd-like [Scaptodrosophila lebanonensis]|uniref:Serine protease inhibitor 42Dd-like n=1 Tax=Drosophila lebanonensis TaxID=7225 RepID=A0A6J2UGB4_DROLE|nr:serine protease inhibitor 42Dd-like [Scaptodrosophila lebanonensis]
MTSSTKENVFFSHTALQLAFKMLRQITNGATSSEIETALQVDRYDSQQLTGQPTEGYMIGIFNGIFLKSPAKSFKRNINSRLGSIEAIDQEHFPQQLKFINSRIARETDNKIIDPVHIEDYIELDKPNKVVSINAAVLSAQWEFPFQSQKTKPREFYGIEKQLIDFMQFDKIRLPYANLESQKIDAQMLLMPFLRTTRNLKMMILLPSKKSNPAVIVSGQMAFFGKSLVQIAKLAKYTDLEVQIPKFEYKCDVELVPDILDDLNIRNIYQEGKADFSPISESPNLALSSMRHITYIQFNEHGINIDNAKKQTLNDVASLGGSIIQFHANRPFFFAILDDNEIYFTGQFENSS